MKKVPFQIYEGENYYLGKIKDKYSLISRAAALELLVKKIKHMKVEGELWSSQ